MKCQEILTLLVSYRDRIIDLLELNQKDIFITISQNNEPLITIRLPALQHLRKTDSIYSDNKSFENAAKTKIEAATWPGFQTNTPTRFPWSNDILQQLESADSIASLAVNCTAGDDYYPGNFSKVILSQHHIELQQINYMDAKSLGGYA